MTPALLSLHQRAGDSRRLQRRAYKRISSYILRRLRKHSYQCGYGDLRLAELNKVFKAPTVNASEVGDRDEHTHVSEDGFIRGDIHQLRCQSRVKV